MAKYSIVLIFIVISAGTMISEAQSDFNIDLSLYEFTSNLYEVLEANFSTGYVVSPLSLYIAISLVAMGAAGDTATETWNAMSIDTDDRQQFSDALLGVLHTFDIDNPKLSYASMIFINETQVLANFTSLATNDFECDSQAVDYNDFATTYRVMSEWIMEHCENGSINSAYSSVYFPDDLFLTSVLAFNAEWETPFDADNTTIGSFFTPDGKATDVEMMYLEGYFLYAHLADVHYLLINYKDSNWSMTFTLPDESADMDGIFTHDNTRSVASILRNVPLSYVKLTLPKCNVSFIADFSKFLPQMGIQKLLEPDADFSAMLKDQNYLSDEDSQYLVKFMMNEWGTGTDLNQATEVKHHAIPAYAGDDIVEYTVNRTFGIAIFNQHSFYELMLGKITNPANVIYSMS